MHPDIVAYNQSLSQTDQEICSVLSESIEKHLPEANEKIWHAHPVWFLDGNPIVGYSLQKQGIRLMFWSGADFDEEDLKVRGQKFKDASIFFTSTSEIDDIKLSRWLDKSKAIQWDYKNIVKRKGVLQRLK
ncbi:MAG: DUF1801 domain-containing protein [Mangrovimonas sp.]|nr:DUF1801 domain-containing protein [Candidatus Saccharibacteria bacterium]MCB0424960.1 DUF1801 domain-containing protein [Mangrovimonas sp.]MCB0426193.1 DUF1801 domain-containing protein [Mangrovimonas sp.]MCB0438982.1 DUF1801 domain-containing protein [Mangrovimonas sp.]